MGVPDFRSRPADAATVDTRAFVGSTFALELDGQFIDFLKSTEGGFPKAEVIQELVGTNYIVKKHIGQPKYQDIAIQCDPVMPKPLFDWIASTLTMSHMRKNGAIITADYNRVIQSRLQFNNALITDIGFPACDAALKEPGYLTVKFAPELTTPSAGKGSLTGAVGAKSKAWLPSDFPADNPRSRLQQGHEDRCTHGQQTIATQTIGEMRDVQKEPGKLEFPNLAITLAETSAGTFYAWFQDMVIKGNAGENNEKAGTLELLDPNVDVYPVDHLFQSPRHFRIFA